MDSVTPISSTPSPIRDVRWNGTVLSFAVHDGDDIDEFELRQTDADHAELTLIISEAQRQELAADRIPLPKPFHLAKNR